MPNTDRAWKIYGESDPYFGVITDGRFMKGRMDSAAKAEFFSSGETYISKAFDVVRSSIAPDFVPKRGLDFGCGVGRLTIPLGRRCETVVGVDISPSMLDEARKNAIEAGLSNAEFVASDDQLTRATGSFDLVHSFIVFQHIRPARGEAILRQLLGRLTEDGIGILHFTYANLAETSLERRARRRLRERFPTLYDLRNVVKTGGQLSASEVASRLRESLRRPHMQMYRYDLNRLFEMLQESGCHDVHVRFSQSSRLGVILYFRKRRFDTTTDS